jgi:hypothetical protein
MFSIIISGGGIALSCLGIVSQQTRAKLGLIKKRAVTGIEPVTSCTRSRHNTTIPNSRRVGVGGGNGKEAAAKEMRVLNLDL